VNTFIAHGPVQIINAERTCSTDTPDDCVLPRRSGERRGLTLLKVVGALVALVIGAAVALRAAELTAHAVFWFLSEVNALVASMVAWITNTVALTVSMGTVVCTWIVRIVLGGWMVGRAAELYLLIERALGGGPWRLILLSRLFGLRGVEVELRPQPEPLQCTSATPQLAARNSSGLAAGDARALLRPSADSPTR
jgi:hypothetical protein